MYIKIKKRLDHIVELMQIAEWTREEDEDEYLERLYDIGNEMEKLYSEFPYLRNVKIDELCRRYKVMYYFYKPYWPDDYPVSSYLA